MVLGHDLDHLKINPSGEIPPLFHLLDIPAGRTPDVPFLLRSDRLAWPSEIESLPCLDLHEAQLSVPFRDDVDLPYDASFNTITR